MTFVRFNLSKVDLLGICWHIHISKMLQTICKWDTRQKKWANSDLIGCWMTIAGEIMSWLPIIFTTSKWIVIVQILIANQNKHEYSDYKQNIRRSYLKTCAIWHWSDSKFLLVVLCLSGENSVVSSNTELRSPDPEGTPGIPGNLFWPFCTSPLIQLNMSEISSKSGFISTYISNMLYDLINC